MNETLQRASGGCEEAGDVRGIHPASNPLKTEVGGIGFDRYIDGSCREC